MTTDEATDPRAGFRIRAVPETAPPIISADEAWTTVAEPQTQGTLALDFFPAPDDDFARAPSRTSTLPDPTTFAAKLAQAIVEVVSGQRPAPQLIRHTTPPVYRVLARRALIASRRPAATAQRPAVVRRVRLCEPRDGVVEAAAVVVAHGRVRALALRLEGLDGRWIITQVAIG